MRVGRVAVAVLAFAGSGCGYQMGGKAVLVPANVRTIAIPAFDNTTARYKLTEILPNAIGREFITRTKYRIVAEASEGDAILRGAVVSYSVTPAVTSRLRVPATATAPESVRDQATGMEITVAMNLSLVEKGSGKVLYQRDGLQIRGRYEAAAQQEQYFDESAEAMRRLSQEIARQVVSSILEAF